MSVYDVARACRLALETPEAAGLAINISSGQAMTVKQVAERTIAAIGRSDIQPAITGNYRSGDVRQCFADIPWRNRCWVGSRRFRSSRASKIWRNGSRTRVRLTGDWRPGRSWRHGD